MEKILFLFFVRFTRASPLNQESEHCRNSVEVIFVYNFINYINVKGGFIIVLKN